MNQNEKISLSKHCNNRKLLGQVQIDDQFIFRKEVFLRKDFKEYLNRDRKSQTLSFIEQQFALFHVQLDRKKSQYIEEAKSQISEKEKQISEIITKIISTQSQLTSQFDEKLNEISIYYNILLENEKQTLPCLLRLKEFENQFNTLCKLSEQIECLTQYQSINCIEKKTVFPETKSNFYLRIQGEILELRDQIFFIGTMQDPKLGGNPELKIVDLTRNKTIKTVPNTFQVRILSKKFIVRLSKVDSQELIVYHFNGFNLKNLFRMKMQSKFWEGLVREQYFIEKHNGNQLSFQSTHTRKKLAEQTFETYINIFRYCPKSKKVLIVLKTLEYFIWDLSTFQSIFNIRSLKKLKIPKIEAIKVNFEDNLIFIQISSESYNNSSFYIYELIDNELIGFKRELPFRIEKVKILSPKKKLIISCRGEDNEVILYDWRIDKVIQTFNGSLLACSENHFILRSGGWLLYEIK